MEGKNRFTPKQINKALRLLRELPVKDGRKSIKETLRLLEHGMREALEKGYSRGEIQHKIAEAEVIISATTLKGFLVAEEKDAGQGKDAATANEPKKISRHCDGKTAGTIKNAGRKLNEKMGGAGHADGEKRHDELEPLPSASVNGAPFSRPEHDGKAVSEPEQSSREQHEDKDGGSQKNGRKQHEVLTGNISPGSIIIRPDTPKEEL